MHEDIYKRNHDEACDFLVYFFKSCNYKIIQNNGSYMDNSLKVGTKNNAVIPDMVLEREDKKIAVEYGTLNGGDEKIRKLLKHFDLVFHIPKGDMMTFILVYQKGLEYIDNDSEEFRELKNQNKELNEKIENLNYELDKYKITINNLINILPDTALKEKNNEYFKEHIKFTSLTKTILVIKCTNCSKLITITEKVNSNGELIYNRRCCYCTEEKLEILGKSHYTSRIENDFTEYNSLGFPIKRE